MTVKASTRIPIKTSLLSTIAVNHEMARLIKENRITPETLEELSVKVWKTHVANDIRLGQLKEEISSIEHANAHMWTRFQEVIAPVTHIGDPMVSVYAELTDVLKELVQLRKNRLTITSEVFNACLIALQERLHKVENNRIPAMNVLMPSETSGDIEHIPCGQAVCFSLLHKAYRLAHSLACEAEAPEPREPPTRLRVICSSLIGILGALEAGYPVDPLLVRVVADEVHDMELSKVNNLFVEEDGSLSPDQDLIAKEIAQAHELINEATHLLGKNFSSAPVTRHDEKFSDIVARVEDVRDTLKDQKEKRSAPATLPALKTLMEPVADAIQFLESRAELAVDSTTMFLGNLVSSTLQLASSALQTLDPVDASLIPIYNELKNVTTELRKIRNNHNWDVLQKGGNKNLVKVFEKYGNQLEELDRRLQLIAQARINGVWVIGGGIAQSHKLAGQDLLNSSYSQANQLLKSLLFN